MASGLFNLKQVNQAISQGAWSGYIAPRWVEYLVVAGGGGGAYTGGGGAGGVLTGIVTVATGASYTVTIGPGGTGGTDGGNNATQGTASVFGSISATGGGAGITNYLDSAAKNNGGSGGGGGLGNVQNGQGTVGQGNAGGLSSASNGGGGGGAGTVGLAATTYGGNGGAGIASAITGTVTTYGGGGGGGFANSINSNPGAGGVGGGGSAGASTGSAAASGGSNTGGGGGGAVYVAPTFYAGGAGGSGIVVVRYPGNVVFFTGGTVNYNNGYIIHIFTSNGTLAPTAPAPYNTSYQISRSLRFNSADTTFLNRTPATATNRRTWTWSAWVKRSTLSTVQELFDGYWANTDNGYFWIGFTSADALEVQLYNSTLRTTTQVFRDVSAWYHIMLAVDTTQATAANRVKLYVNGAEVTAFSTNNAPTQDLDTAVNYNGAHYIGTFSGTTNLFNGYQTEINLIDGQALTPSSFGATSTTTGVWSPIQYTGTYGTNGFYLNFSDNSNTTAATLGKDYSGNGNNWTPNNFSVTAGAGNDSMVDSPTQYGFDTGVGGTVRGNYSTMNPVNKGSTVTLSNGNLDQVTASGGWNSARASIAVASGKWYWEVTITGTSQLVMHGVDDNTYNVTTNPSSTYVGAYNNSWGVYASNGQKRNNTGSGTAYGSAFAQNDVMIVAMDMDSGKIWWGKNGTWFASGDPVAGTNAAYTNLSGYTLNPATSGFDTTDSCTHNFGQRPFAYTAPSGFKALCTQNLPTPTIGATSNSLATQFFNPVIYTGAGGSQTISGVGFQPDFVWMKTRSNSGPGAGHILQNAVTGVTKGLQSNDTAAEFTDATTLTAFNSDGYVVGGNSQTNASARTYVAWNWRAGNNAGASNSAGSITSTVSANTTSGFSIVTYTNTSSGVATVGHGLGVAPSMIIFKTRSTAFQWNVYHTSLGNNSYIVLNTTAAESTGATTLWNSTSPTSTVFTLGTAWPTFLPSATMVAYCFAPVAGYSAFGSYTGNGSADGPFVFTGFRPAYILWKRTDSTADWTVFDTSRDTYNVAGPYLNPNTSAAELTDSTVQMDLLSNGFKVRGTWQGVNASGGTFVFMAFAQNPFKYSLAR
jgi:hypothetical protein